MTRIRRFFPVCIRTFLLLGCVVGASGLTTFLPAQSVPQARLTEAVDENRLSTLRGNTPPQANATYDQGKLADSEPAGRMLLVLKRSPEQEVALNQLLADLHNPKSASFHRWLKPEEFSQQFGPAEADLQTVSSWLQAHGFAVDKVSRGGTVVQFSGTVAQVSDAFHTELHTYVKDGATYHSNDRDPQVPAALTPVVSGIAALNDILPQHDLQVLGKVAFDSRTHDAVPQWSYPASGGRTLFAFAPGDAAVQYNLVPLYQSGTTGRGETIGIISQAGVDNTVVGNYRKLFGLSANLPTEVVDGNDPGTNGDQAGVEADLDVEVSGSVAPDAQVVVYTSADTIVGLGLYTAAIRAVDDNLADVLSLSYGICETNLGVAGNQLFNNLWAQAAAQGQSVFVSSGDSGSAGCDLGYPLAMHGLAVNGFASTPYNTAVGGTDFYYSSYKNSDALQTQIASYWNTATSTTPVTSLLQPVPEQPWNDYFGLNAIAATPGTGFAGTGGGPSTCVRGVEDTTSGKYVSCAGGYAKPSWQSGPGVPNDGVRDTPDVSLFAANGYNLAFWPMCNAVTDCIVSETAPGKKVQITGVGGTSASSPAMAGIMALVDQSQKGRQGNPNLKLYALAAQVPGVFHDITVGSNNLNCLPGSTDCSLDTNGDKKYSLQVYPAGPGYDLASGLGSVDAARLVGNWNKVSFTSTTTTLSLSSTSFTHGTPITAVTSVESANVAPSGSVALVSSVAGGLGVIPLTNGVGQTSTNTLPGGNYTLLAQYGGDGTFAGSTSTPVQVSVTPESATVSMKALNLSATTTSEIGAPIQNGATFDYGNSPVFDIQVYGASSSAAHPDGSPTGQITLLDNGVALILLNLNANGLAQYSAASLLAGAHAITASYSGDSSFQAAKSAALTFTVAKSPAGVHFTYLDGSEPPNILSPAGGKFEVQIYVGALNGFGTAPVAGSVTVTYGAQSQTLQLSPTTYGGYVAFGTATAVFDNSVVGEYKLDASYSGDANILPAATAVNPATVKVYTASTAATTTTMSASSTSVGPEGALNLSVQVTGGSTTPSGIVYVSANGANETVGLLDSSGTLSFPATFTGSGPTQFVASYTGDSTHSPSTSLPISVTANVGDFSLTASSQMLPIVAGSSGSATIAVGAPFTNSLAGTVSLTCATSSPSLVCTISQPTLTLPVDPGQQATTSLTINTHQAAATATALPALDLHLVGGSLSLAALLFFIPTRRRAWKAGSLLLLLVCMGFGASGCAGNTPPSTPVPNPGTNATPGTYTATLTAVGSGITHSLVINVVVQ